MGGIYIELDVSMFYEGIFNDSSWLSYAAGCDLLLSSMGGSVLLGFCSIIREAKSQIVFIDLRPLLAYFSYYRPT